MALQSLILFYDLTHSLNIPKIYFLKFFFIICALLEGGFEAMQLCCFVSQLFVSKAAWHAM